MTSDGIPSLGELGVCSGGPRSGTTCRVEGLADPGYGSGAGTSRDCPPAAVLTLMHLAVPVTTGRVTRGTDPGSPNCTASGFSGQKCLCPSGAGEPTRPNACVDDSSTPEVGSKCLDVEGDDGVCPDKYDLICADAPWRFCFDAIDCPTGACVPRRRPCFLDPIVREGSADPPSNDVAEPTLVGAFCMLPVAQAGVNAAVGLPGPAAFVMPARVVITP